MKKIFVSLLMAASIFTATAQRDVVANSVTLAGTKTTGISNDTGTALKRTSILLTEYAAKQFALNQAALKMSLPASGYGSAGYILQSQGPGQLPTWIVNSSTPISYQRTAIPYAGVDRLLTSDSTRFWFDVTNRSLNIGESGATSILAMSATTQFQGSGTGGVFRLLGAGTTDATKSIEFRNNAYIFKRLWSTGNGDSTAFFEANAAHLLPTVTNRYDLGSAIARYKSFFSRNSYFDTAVLNHRFKYSKSPGTGKILESDSSGVASWSDKDTVDAGFMMKITNVSAKRARLDFDSANYRATYGNAFGSGGSGGGVTPTQLRDSLQKIRDSAILLNLSSLTANQLIKYNAITERWDNFYLSGTGNISYNQSTGQIVILDNPTFVTPSVTSLAFPAGTTNANSIFWGSTSDLSMYRTGASQLTIQGGNTSRKIDINVGSTGTSIASTNSGSAAGGSLSLRGGGANNAILTLAEHGTLTRTLADSLHVLRLVQNSATAKGPILVLANNAGEVANIDIAGRLTIPYTTTPAGTTGNQVIHKPSGRVNFAAGASTITITNNLVTTNSTVLVQVHGTDPTAKTATVTLSAGFIVITLNAAATAETAVSFFVINR